MFITLQEARESADYDSLYSVSKAVALTNVALAEQFMTLVEELSEEGEPSFERCGATLGISPQPILGKQFARGVFGACGGNIHPRGVMAREIHIQR